jgi:hypothetical protein
VRLIKRSEREELPPMLRDAEVIAALTRSDEQLVFFLRVARALPDDFPINDDVRGRDSWPSRQPPAK